MPKFRKKPIVVEARQYNGTSASAYAILSWVHENGHRGRLKDGYKDQGLDTLLLRTLEGEMTVLPHAWVVRGSQGEFWAVKEDIFKETYESVDEDEYLS